jgi:5,10-methylenetetrahydrofolate reductase
MFRDFLNNLQNNLYLSLEITPPHEPNFDTIINKLNQTQFLDKISAFTVTDSPLAKLKYNSIFASVKLQNYFNKVAIATMSMRDRNKIALQSDLLAANDFDIRAILALTGDPASMSDQPHTKGVFESNSLLLLDIIKSFNNNMDYRGKPFTIAPKTFYPFAVIPSFAKSFKTIEKRIIKKINGGAIGIISQPIYDIDNAKKLLESFNKVNKNSTLIFGFFPITKLRTARFLSSQVPGIYVPDSWIEMLSKAHNISELEEEKVGFKLSQQLFLELKNLHPKIHIMSANKFDLINQLIK